MNLFLPSANIDNYPIRIRMWPNLVLSLFCNLDAYPISIGMFSVLVVLLSYLYERWRVPNAVGFSQINYLYFG